MSEKDTAQGVTGEDEVVDLCRDLIRFDTSNYGDHSGPGERQAAEWVAEKLAEVGLEPKIYESHPGRASTVARIAGEDPSRPALLIHGHLDVVPANADDWTHHPFSGEIADGCVWGRGAVDMKDMDAMTLAVVRDRLRSGRRPPRDIVVAFLADEEAGGTFGARHLVDHHPELFEGVTEAISEVGGFSFTVNEHRRLYLIQTAEKGMHWMKLTVAGTAGHGSMIHRDNAITELSEAVARVGRHKFPVRVTKTTRAFLDELGDALGTFASGITVITAPAAEGESGPAGFACQSFSSLSLDPPLVCFMVARTSTTWPRIARAGVFCVNILGADQAELCRAFAVRGADKFAGVPHTPAPRTGSPRLLGATAWIDCAVHAVHPGGDHLIVTGRVDALGTADDPPAPLLFHRGRFGRLAD
ncbi:M20/M25/M40 family metallo-hydrolase [Streptomyces sp. SID6139]|nr:M20/M25/M40 family metallo-hydrolase [Streptomyces sp. SID6139]